LLVLLAAIGLRVAFFSGYGLGDDPNYFAAYHRIYQRGTFDPRVAYDLRFTFSYPVVWFLKAFGVQEWSFVGFVTTCSVANVLLVYAIARQEWDRGTALIAMTLMAVLPLEVTTATLFANDVVLATYCYAALWLYRAGCSERIGQGRRDMAAILAGVLLFAGYLTKQWGLIVGAIFACEALARPRATWRASLLCLNTLATLVTLYLGAQWYFFGDPLHDFHVVRRVSYFHPHSWPVVTDYSKMLLLPSEYGTWFAGWYPHLLLTLAVLFVHRLRKAGKWLLYFLVELAALSAMPSHREDGHWVLLVPHIFRYLCFLSIPLVLALTAYVRELLLVGGRTGVVLVGAALVLFVKQSADLSWPTRDAFGEQRRVGDYLLKRYPVERFASDSGFFSRMANFRLGGVHTRFVEIVGNTPEARAGQYLQLRDVVVITGGARLPWYGCVRCATSIGDFSPLPSWRLVAALPGPQTPYRREPLLVWRVSGPPVP
jgi:4-amino-4-deoxy-L-arabinose transferase-like glycosyltransferase